MRYDVDVNGHRHEVTVHRGDGRFSVRLGADYVRGFRSNSLDDVEHYRLQSGVVFKLP